MMTIQVTAAVIRREGKTLLCGRAPEAALADCFEFPGGKQEPGETLAQCLRREIREELGTQVAVLDCLGEKEVLVNGKCYHLNFLRALLPPGAPEPEPREGQPMKWVPTVSLTACKILPGDIPMAEFLEASEKTLKNFQTAQ